MVISVKKTERSCDRILIMKSQCAKVPQGLISGSSDQMLGHFVLLFLVNFIFNLIQKCMEVNSVSRGFGLHQVYRSNNLTFHHLILLTGPIFVRFHLNILNNFSTQRLPKSLMFTLSDGPGSRAMK